jgi:hypothetical protein
MVKCTVVVWPGSTRAVTVSLCHGPTVVSSIMSHSFAKASPLKLSSPVGRPFMVNEAVAPAETGKRCERERLEDCTLMRMQRTSAGTSPSASVAAPTSS